MKKLSAFLLGLGLALLVGPVVAATGNLSYTRPTAYTDGTALPAGDIASYNVRCASFTPTGSTTPQACPAITPTTLPGTATGGTITLTIPAAGGRACFQVQTVVTSGATSDWSTEGCKTFAPATPNPPGNVTVAVVIGINMAPVYSVTKAGKLSTLMGFADLGVACGSQVLFTYRGREFREVPRDAVHWWGETALRVAAPCAAG